MPARIDIITLGVNELEAAREFYEGGFGASVRAENDALKVSLGPNASCLDLGSSPRLRTSHTFALTAAGAPLAASLV